MKKPVVILLHIGFWLCYVILGMFILGVVYGDSETIDEAKIEQSFNVILFFAWMPAIITFYSFYFLIFPKFILRKKYLKGAGIGILISVAAASMGFFILVSIYGTNCGVEAAEEDPMFGVLIFMSLVALIPGIIALIMQGFITWFGEIKLKETLKQKNQAMELALVKSQLDPHFLFNTINNIDVLILKNPETASTYLNKLSDIMRFMLYETKTDKISLSKEIEYIEKYIELQKIRTANESYVNFEVTGDPKDKTIAPMVFIPFIENAFKHTNNKKVENAIEIQIAIDNGRIELICANRFIPNGSPKNNGSNGLGNELIQKRLQLIYPDQHQLNVSNENNLYSVNLTIENG